MKKSLLACLVLFMVGGCASSPQEKSKEPNELEVQSNMLTIMVDGINTSWGYTTSVDDVDYDKMNSSKQNDLYCQYSTIDGVDKDSNLFFDVPYDVCGAFYENKFYIVYFTFNNELILDNANENFDDEGKMLPSFIEYIKND